MSAANHLRMPLAEWFYRMHEADVPYQARSLALHCVLYKITANDELARLSGMDMKGVADKTYNRWKRILSDGGWVIIKAVTIGRQTTIEVSPAINETPVTFTDISPRDPAKFGQSKSYGREVEVTGQSYVSDVKVTDESRKNYEPAVEITAEIENLPCAPAHAEVSNIYNNINNLPKASAAAFTQDTARDPAELSDRLIACCNGALDNPANCSGLLSVGIPLAWLNSGCDLELDVVPTLSAIGKRAHGKRIKSWSYFSDAVYGARDARLAPPSSGKGRAGKEGQQERMRRIFAQIETSEKGGAQ